MAKEITTESASHYDDLEQMSVHDLLAGINAEDQKVALAVQKELPAIEKFVKALVNRMTEGGRLFYIGAGTSGRLGIVDASECPPTFGVPHDLVVGLIAGGDGAIRKAVEFAEDDPAQAWKDLLAFGPKPEDTVVGIAASGRTPYVIGGVKKARENGLLTACITCNSGSELAGAVEYPVEVVVGPEFVTGSTRMKAGTAQKMVLNMISTCAMIRLGRVKGNRMVDMQLTNHKLVDRGVRMLTGQLSLTPEEAKKQLEVHGSVRAVLKHFSK
jgi:N-acetylmuramic acid 6-phosphate etherase